MRDPVYIRYKKSNLQLGSLPPLKRILLTPSLMNETIRVFLAIDLPAPLQSALADLIGQLRHRNFPGIRLIKPDNLHITMKFMGNVSVNKIPDIAKAVSEIIGLTTPFDLETGPIVIFPNERFPRVISVGFTGNLNPVTQMHQLVETTMASLGIVKERRPFTPHLTIARMSNDASLDVRTSAISLVDKYWAGSGLDFQVNSVSLIKSNLSSIGASYETIANFELKNPNRL